MSVGRSGGKASANRNGGKGGFKEIRRCRGKPGGGSNGGTRRGFIRGQARGWLRADSGTWKRRDGVLVGTLES